MTRWCSPIQVSTHVWQQRPAHVKQSLFTHCHDPLRSNGCGTLSAHCWPAWNISPSNMSFLSACVQYPCAAATTPACWLMRRAEVRRKRMVGAIGMFCLELQRRKLPSGCYLPNPLLHHMATMCPDPDPVLMFRSCELGNSEGGILHGRSRRVCSLGLRLWACVRLGQA